VIDLPDAADGQSQYLWVETSCGRFRLLRACLKRKQSRMSEVGMKAMKVSKSTDMNASSSSEDEKGGDDVEWNEGDE